MPPRSTPMTPRSTTRRTIPLHLGRRPPRREARVHGLSLPATLPEPPPRRRGPRAAAGAAARRPTPRSGATRSAAGPGAPRRRITPGRVLKYLGLALLGWLLVSAVLFLVSAQIQSSKIDDAANEQLGGGGFPLTTPNTILVLGSDARTEENAEPGAQTIGAPEPQRLDPAAAGGRRRQRAALDPARHGRRHPRPRGEQDQRRLRARRPGAGDRDRRGLPRHRGQPPRRGQLRELPGARRRARRHRLPGPLRDLQHQRRHQERRLHAAPEGRHARDRRRAGAGARPHAQERVQPERGRPRARAPPAEDHERDQGQGDLVRDLRPAAVGRLGGTRRPCSRTCPGRRCWGWSPPS